MVRRVKMHEHARSRLDERGISEDEVVRTVLEGEQFPAKYGRVGFRRNFAYGALWRGRAYATKQVEAIAVDEDNDWLVITVIARYF